MYTTRLKNIGMNIGMLALLLDIGSKQKSLVLSIPCSHPAQTYVEPSWREMSGGNPYFQTNILHACQPWAYLSFSVCLLDTLSPVSVLSDTSNNLGVRSKYLQSGLKITDQVSGSISCLTPDTSGTSQIISFYSSVIVWLQACQSGCVISGSDVQLLVGFYLLSVFVSCGLLHVLHLFSSNHQQSVTLWKILPYSFNIYSVGVSFCSLKAHIYSVIIDATIDNVFSSVKSFSSLWDTSLFQCAPVNAAVSYNTVQAFIIQVYRNLIEYTVDIYSNKPVWFLFMSEIAYCCYMIYLFYFIYFFTFEQIFHSLSTARIFRICKQWYFQKIFFSHD